MDFDGWDVYARELIDRKLNVGGKSVAQARRQAKIAKQYGVKVRWEVARRNLRAAENVLKSARVKDTITAVAPKY